MVKMTNLPTKTDKKWPEGLIVDYAMMKASEVAGLASVYTLNDIAALYGLDVETIKLFEQDPEFIRETRAEMMEVKKTSPHLQKKAALILENWLDTQAMAWIGQSSEGNLSEKLKVVEQITKISGLLEKQKAALEVSSAANNGDNKGYQPTFTINFNGMPAQHEKVIN